MRKILCLVMTVVLLVSLTACSRKIFEPEPPWDGDGGQINPSGPPAQESESSVGFCGRVAYANFAEDPLITEKCLNAEKVKEDGREHLPVYLIRSVKELEGFISDFEDIFSLHRGYNEVLSFDESVKGYDELFFQQGDLLMAYTEASSGSFRFGIGSLTADGDELCMHVVQTNDPEAYTADMAGWLVIAEINKSDTDSFSSFDADISKDPDRYVTLPGMIEYGTFSYKEIRENIIYGNPGMKTDGFVNTEETDEFLPVERAKAELTHEYGLAQYFYDPDEDVWMVCFFNSTDTDSTIVYMNGRGVTLLITYEG